MSSLTHPTQENDVGNVQGHTIGFVDSFTDCQLMVRSLNQAGFDQDKIRVFHGVPGIAEWEQTMEGSQWGESAENALKEGLGELRLGHCVVLVEVKDAKQASAVAAISTQHGGHGVYHFGFLIDTRLTP